MALSEHGLYQIDPCIDDQFCFLKSHALFYETHVLQDPGLHRAYFQVKKRHVHFGHFGAGEKLVAGFIHLVGRIVSPKCPIYTTTFYTKLVAFYPIRNCARDLNPFSRDSFVAL